MNQMIPNDRQIPRIGAVRIKLFAGGIVLLILALGFNALLTYGSLEKLYIESIVASYQVVGKDLQRKLEQSLRFGKSIQRFIGMNNLLEETKKRLTARLETRDPEGAASRAEPERSVDGVTVSVALPDATILYSADEPLVGTTVPKKAWLHYDPAGASNSPPAQRVHYAKYQHSYFITLPVRDREKTWVATIVMGFGEEQVEILLHQLVQRDLKLIAIVLVFCIIFLLLALHLLIPDQASPDLWRFPKTKVYTMLIVIVGSAQIFFSVFNLNDYRNYLLQITREQVHTLVLFLKEDIEYLFSKGIRIDHLVKMDVVMGEILAASPELGELTIYDREQAPLYRATPKGITDFQKTQDGRRQSSTEAVSPADLPYRLGADLAWEGITEGRISGTISKEAVAAKLGEVLLDSATVLVISLLFLVEILILMLPFIERQIHSDRHAAVHYQTMRPAAFLFLFGVDICISFLPLYMERLYVPMAGLSKDIVIGIPISVRMFFTGISILAAGTWCDRRGWHEPFLSGLVLAGTGFIYAWLAPNALHFIASQALFGLGYGCSLMASQGFVVTHTDETNRARGLAQLWAGVYAGSICGGAAGAMLAERIGYGPIFFVGAVILFLIVPYTLIFMRGAMQKPKRGVSEPEPRAFSFGQILDFASNRNVVSLILLSSLPMAIAVVGFLNYFIPVYLNRVGTTQSNIGRVLMIYGICLIYIAPLLSRHIDTWPSRKPFIVAGGVLGGLAVMLFSFIEGLWGIVLSAFFLGLSSSFGFASQSGYVLRLSVTRELGKGRALGMYSSANRLGQVLGPLTFGWLLVTIGANQGTIYFGLAYLLLTVLFLLVAQNDGKADG
jgi:predicted MFS family arabinose efflux permease